MLIEKLFTWFDQYQNKETSYTITFDRYSYTKNCFQPLLLIPNESRIWYIEWNRWIPYPTSIIQTDFKNFDSDSHEIDLFLYKNYRFSSIDSIIKELTELSTNLNQNLLDLVNDDYHDFIDLGKSINDGLDLINAIVEDLKNFEIELVNYYKNFWI